MPNVTEIKHTCSLVCNFLHMLQCRHFLGIAMEMPYSSGVHDYGRVKLPGFVASLSRKPKHFKHFSLLKYIIGSCSYKIMFIAEWINCY